MLAYYLQNIRANVANKNSFYFYAYVSGLQLGDPLVKLENGTVVAEEQVCELDLSSETQLWAAVQTLRAQ